MATTYTATRAGSTYQPRANIAETFVQSKYTSPVFVINDIVQMVKVPAGAMILNLTLSVSDLDTNVSPAIVFSVGDGDDTDRYILINTSAQAGGVARMDNPAGHLYVYTAEDTIDVKITTAPATGATGTIYMSVLYTMEGIS